MDRQNENNGNENLIHTSQVRTNTLRFDQRIYRDISLNTINPRLMVLQTANNNLNANVSIFPLLGVNDQTGMVEPILQTRNNDDQDQPRTMRHIRHRESAINNILNEVLNIGISRDNLRILTENRPQIGGLLRDLATGEGERQSYVDRVIADKNKDERSR